MSDQEPWRLAGMMPATKLTIGSLVTFDVETGEMVFHEGYTPEGAAKIFWDAMHHELLKRKA